MKKLALDAGFNEADASRMAAIAMAESSGNPNTVGSVGELGLVQVNPHAWGQETANRARDPAEAFKVAKMIRDKQGWNAWSVYKNQRHLEYLQQAQQAQPVEHVERPGRWSGRDRRPQSQARGRCQRHQRQAHRRPQIRAKDARLRDHGQRGLCDQRACPRQRALPWAGARHPDRRPAKPGQVGCLGSRR